MGVGVGGVWYVGLEMPREAHSWQASKQVQPCAALGACPFRLSIGGIRTALLPHHASANMCGLGHACHRIKTHLYSPQTPQKGK